MAHLSSQGPNLATSSTTCASPASKTPSRASREGCSPSSATAPVSPTSTSSRFSRGDDAAATAMQIETLMQAMGDLLARIAESSNFSFTSSPAAFKNTIASCLTDTDFHLPNGDIVGLCCSSLLGLQFPEDGTTTSPTADTDGLMAAFRPFLLAASLARAGWRDTTETTAASEPLQTRSLHASGHIPNYRLLKRLDCILTPELLSRLGPESCQVLFLLVLGAVLGVGHSASSQPDTHDRLPEFPAETGLLSPEFQRSPTLWLAMKERLCQMLAQHLISLGSMLGIRIETRLEQRIVDMAAKRWTEVEEVVWADVVGLGRNELGTAELPGGLKGEGGEEGFGGFAPPPPPRPVPMPCPEAGQFQKLQTVDAWSENPRSYLAMFEESETLGVGSITAESRDFSGGGTSPSPRQEAEPKPQRHATFELEPRRRPEGKRRSIWLVRPVHSGPECGLVNAHTRLRGGTSMESLRAFVI